MNYTNAVSGHFQRDAAYWVRTPLRGLTVLGAVTVERVAQTSAHHWDEEGNEPSSLLIRFQVQRRVNGELVSQPCQIVLDAGRPLFDRNLTTLWLIDPEPRKARHWALKILLFFLLPVIFPLGRYLEWYNERRKLTREGVRLLDCLEGKLDLRTESLLNEALHIDWLFQHRSPRDLSSDEAWYLLRQSGSGFCVMPEQCDCTPHVVDPAGVQICYHWNHPEYGHFAQGYLRRNEYPVLRVYATEFTKERGDDLGYSVFELMWPWGPSDPNSAP